MKEITLVDINGNIAMENKMEKLVDIIIPAFKSQNTIIKTLHSIAMQTAAEVVKVTIIDDCDPVGFVEIVGKFSNSLEIEVIVLNKNYGPGVARQVGLDNTNCPYILFVDADDTLQNAYAIETMLEIKQEHPTAAIITFPFYETQKREKIDFLRREENMVWVFSKLYDRAFIRKHGIKFPTSRANEDVYFNRLIELCIEDMEESPQYYDFPVYVWHYNPNSITRENQHEYALNGSLLGYARNCIDVIAEASKRKYIKKQIINLKIVDLMTIMYQHYTMAVDRNPKIADELFELNLEFYNRFYSRVEMTFPKELLHKFIMESYEKRIYNISKYIPHLTYYQFTDKLREESKRREELND